MCVLYSFDNSFSVVLEAILQQEEDVLSSSEKALYVALKARSNAELKLVRFRFTRKDVILNSTSSLSAALHPHTSHVHFYYNSTCCYFKLCTTTEQFWRMISILAFKEKRAFVSVWDIFFCICALHLFQFSLFLVFCGFSVCLFPSYEHCFVFCYYGLSFTSMLIMHLLFELLSC